MRQVTYVSEREKSHWFELNPVGELTQTVICLGAQVEVSNWKLHEGILDYRLVIARGVLHAVALTKNGLYYMKRQDRESEQQAVRMESHRGISSLFISLQGEVIYIGYMLNVLQENSFVLRRYQHGEWRVSKYPIPVNHVDATFILKQAVYTMNVNGILFGMLLIEELQNGLSRLCSFMLNTSDDEIVWQSLFESKSVTSGWQICICHDSVGDGHASWVFQQGQSVHHFYNRLHAVKNHRFRYISLEQEVPQPYFMNQMGILILIFVYNGEKIIFTSSQDEGEQWTSFQEIQFQTGFPLAIIQGIRSEQELVITNPVIGFTTPLFRPLAWMDIIHPFYSFKTLSPFKQIASYMMVQFNQMEQYMRQELIQFQRNLNQLVQRKQYLEGKIKKAKEELDQLTTVEQLLLRELNANGNQSEEEHIANRRI